MAADLPTFDGRGLRVRADGDGGGGLRKGAERLGGNSVGMQPWKMMDVAAQEGRVLRVVGTPARHGPAGLSRGAVTGFVLFLDDAPGQAVYFSGDTVWYEGVAEVAKRFPVRAAILNLGAARVPEVGPFHLTMTANEAVQAAGAFAEARIIPLHYDGWAHFSEGAKEIAAAFELAGMSDRLLWGEAGNAVAMEL